MGEEEDRIPFAPTHDDFVYTEDKKTLVNRFKASIKAMRPKVDFSKIVLSLGFKQENQGHLVALGPKGGEMRVFNQDNITFRADFSRRYSGALGPSAETIIAEDTETLRRQENPCEQV